MFTLYVLIYCAAASAHPADCRALAAAPSREACEAGRAELLRVGPLSGRLFCARRDEV